MKLLISVSERAPKLVPVKQWRVGNDPLFAKYRALHSNCLELHYLGHTLQIFGMEAGYIGVIDGIVFERIVSSLAAKAKLAKSMQRSVQ